MKKAVEFMLGDLFSFCYGKMPDPNNIVTESPSGFPIYSGYRFVGFYNKYMYNEPRLIVVARGVGGTGDVKIAPPKTWITNLSIIFNPKGNLSNIKYLLYFFRKYNLRFLDTGSAQSQITSGDLQRLKIPLPALPIQRKIAAVLSAYDDLIENNNRRIAILGKMAEELYREWFIRLRFPGYEKVKIVKGVPEGWEIKRLNEVASVIDCLHTKKPENIMSGEGWLLQLENIKENGRFNKSYKYLISKRDYDEWKKNIEVREGDCLITNVGRIAAVAQISRGVKAALGRNMTAVRHNSIPASFLIQYLLSSDMQEEVTKKQDLGAIMGALNVRGINKLEIRVPDKQILDDFDKVVSKIRISLWNLFDKNELLTTSRNRLLSRLMSGKIDVENLDIQFPDSMEEEVTSNA